MIRELIAKLAAKYLGKKIGLQEGTAMDSKKWYQSKGVWTGIVTVIVGAYETTKVALAPQFGWTLPDIPPLAYTILGALGIYSRAVANTKIG